jgi:hypothetical protein
VYYGAEFTLAQGAAEQHTAALIAGRLASLHQETAAALQRRAQCTSRQPKCLVILSTQPPQLQQKKLATTSELAVGC